MAAARPAAPAPIMATSHVRPSLRRGMPAAYTAPVSLNLFERPSVANYAVQPGARVVWCMKRRTTDVRCVVFAQGMPVEIQVVHGRDVVVTEMFQEEWMALNWARAYKERLRAQGWQDVPGEPN